MTKNKSEFDRLFDLVSSKKSTPDQIKKGITGYSGSLEDVEGIFKELESEQPGRKSRKPWIGIGIISTLVVGMVSVFVFRMLTPPAEPEPTVVPSTPTQLISPTITFTPIPTLVPASETPSPAPTAVPASEIPTSLLAPAPTSETLTPQPTAVLTNETPALLTETVVMQYVSDRSVLSVPLPICSEDASCAVWQLGAAPNPLPNPTEALSLPASAVKEVSSVWEMTDPGMDLDAMVAVYLMDYSVYDNDNENTISTGPLDYSITVEESLNVGKILLSDIEPKNSWIPLGLYPMQVQQKIKVEARMKANNSYLPIGPVLVVRFSDSDQEKLENLRKLIGYGQIAALLDEDSLPKKIKDENENWLPEQGSGFGGDRIAIDEKDHPKFTWKLTAGLEEGEYDIYIYMPEKNVAPSTSVLTCGETEFIVVNTDGSQWYKSVGSVNVKEGAKSFEFSCNWNNKIIGEPVYLDAIAIVKHP